MLVIYFRWSVTDGGGFDTMAYEGSLPLDLISRMNEINKLMKESNYPDTYLSWRLF